MIKLWRHLIRPILVAAEAKSILEIGAEFGTSTKTLLKYVKETGGHLHCIDPVPAFDADEFQKANPELVTFYRDLSLNVIPDLPHFDVAMVDGDHNWYTVYNELKQIEAIHGHDPMAQPLIFAHDIGWPYGRRDLYYDPSNIPVEFRHPHEQKGMLPKKSELLDGKGMNLELWNATHEGGERNGVLTGVDDYIKESQLEYEFLNLPLYYGLGILITKQRLAANAALAVVFNQLKFPRRALEVIALAEHLRCTDGVMLQAINRRLQASEARVAELEEKLAQAGSFLPKSAGGELDS
jgi:hypothetical protein